MATSPPTTVRSTWMFARRRLWVALARARTRSSWFPPAVTVETALNKVPEGFRLSAKITATVFGVDQAKADELVADAHAFCPYSKAMRGEIDVEAVATVG